jgi:hypothetical protein
MLHCCFVTLEYCYTVPLLSCWYYTDAQLHRCTDTLLHSYFAILLHCYPEEIYCVTVLHRYAGTQVLLIVTLLLKHIATLLLPCSTETRLHYFTIIQLNLLTVSQLRCYFVTLTNNDENARPNSNSENILLLAFLVAKIPAKCCSAVHQLSVHKRNQMLFLWSTFNYPKPNYNNSLFAQSVYIPMKRRHSNKSFLAASIFVLRTKYI